jgi:anti-sigma regulatory factor (Ser/Thr protein kinase)
MKNILDALMTPILSITLSNHLSELERLHQVLWQFGKKHNLPYKVINTMNLALEEVITNVIKHGYEDTGEHAIKIRCSVQDGQVLAEVEDDGQPFNPLECPDPDVSMPLEDRPLGGLGIYLVRNVMDALDYHYQEGKNRIKLTKRIDEY